MIRTYEIDVGDERHFNYHGPLAPGTMVTLGDEDDDPATCGSGTVIACGPRHVTVMWTAPAKRSPTVSDWLKKNMEGLSDDMWNDLQRDLQDDHKYGDALVPIEKPEPEDPTIGSWIRSFFGHKK